MIVTRLQTQRQTKSTDNPEIYTSFVDAIEKIYSSEGILGFYSGWGQDTIASVSSTFFYHFAYQFLREKRLRRATLKGEKTLGALEELLVGSLAGVFARFFTTPMNNLVTRKQTSGQNSPDGKVASSASIIKAIYKEKGITGILREKAILIIRILVWLSIFNSFNSQPCNLILSLRIIQINIPTQFAFSSKLP